MPLSGLHSWRKRKKFWDQVQMNMLLDNFDLFFTTQTSPHSGSLPSRTRLGSYSLYSQSIIYFLSRLITPYCKFPVTALLPSTHWTVHF